MNMSRMHVYETGFVARVNKIVNKYNIPPYLLEFELTETVILKNLTKVREVADELRSLVIVFRLMIMEQVTQDEYLARSKF